MLTSGDIRSKGARSDVAGPIQPHRTQPNAGSDISEIQSSKARSDIVRSASAILDPSRQDPMSAILDQTTSDPMSLRIRTRRSNICRRRILNNQPACHGRRSAISLEICGAADLCDLPRDVRLYLSARTAHIGGDGKLAAPLSYFTTLLV